MSHTETILSNIREIRKKKGLSQETIARDLDIDYSTYGKIERGLIELTVPRMYRIAEILGVSINELMGTKNANPIPEKSILKTMKYSEERLFVRYILDFKEELLNAQIITPIQAGQISDYVQEQLK